jgi:hypothetical protein
VLNHRQQKLVDRLYSQQKFVSPAFENVFLASFPILIRKTEHAHKISTDTRKHRVCPNLCERGRPC